MTNLENFIKKMVKTIKDNQGADSFYHWSELAAVLEEALKYIPSGKEFANHDFQFVGYTNGDQLLYAATEKDGGGAFYPDTEKGFEIPLYMLKSHWARVETTSNGRVTIDQLQTAWSKL